MKRKTAATMLVSALALVLSTMGTIPAHAVSAGDITISCKIDIAFPVATATNGQDCVGTADGVAAVLPDGNVIVATGNPTWAVGKVTQPCGAQPKPNGGGKCKDNFRAYDIVYNEPNDAAGFASGRFEIACVDITKGVPCVINGSFDYTRVGVTAVVTIPSKATLKNSKGKTTNNVQIKEAGKTFTCTTNPSGAGAFVFLPKGVPATPPAKTTFWITGTAAVAC